MPKYNRHFHGDPIQVLERLDQEIRKSTYTISLVEESQTELSGVSCVLRLYEAYRIDGSRADMTIALMTDGHELCLSAVVNPSFFLPTKGKLPTVFLPLPTLSCWIREGTTEESSHFSPGLAIVPGGLSGYHTDRTKPRPPAPAGSASPSQKGGPPP